MLTETELFQLCQNLNISQQAQQIITEIRLSPPLRPCFQNIQPIALNFLITLRTVWSSQLNVRAIRRAVSLRALANTIWLRRISNRSCERRPVFSLSHSSSVNSRT